RRRVRRARVGAARPLAVRGLRLSPGPVLVAVRPVPPLGDAAHGDPHRAPAGRAARAPRGPAGRAAGKGARRHAPPLAAGPHARSGTQRGRARRGRYAAIAARPRRWLVLRRTAPETMTTEHLRLLAEASTLLAATLDVSETLREIAQAIVPDFADWCTITLV